MAADNPDLGAEIVALLGQLNTLRELLRGGALADQYDTAAAAIAVLAAAIDGILNPA